MLRVLERSLRILRSLRSKGREAFVSDEATQDRVDRNAQLAAQAAADIALHIVAASGAAGPETYADALLELGRLGIVAADTCASMAGVARLRNLLVHGYTDIDHGRIFDELDWLDDATVFAEQVDGWLSTLSR
jgi:uncharacterized protein YutE (UPF0331/DUF86 family)